MKKNKAGSGCETRGRKRSREQNEEQWTHLDNFKSSILNVEASKVIQC